MDRPDIENEETDELLCFVKVILELQGTSWFFAIISWSTYGYWHSAFQGSLPFATRIFHVQNKRSFRTTYYWVPEKCLSIYGTTTGLSCPPRKLSSPLHCPSHKCRMSIPCQLRRYLKTWCDQGICKQSHGLRSGCERLKMYFLIQLMFYNCLLPWRERYWIRMEARLQRPLQAWDTIWDVSRAKENGCVSMWPWKELHPYQDPFRRRFTPDLWIGNWHQNSG